MALADTSAAIDQGNATACLDTRLQGRDQRGYNRFADGNGDNYAYCDIGAFKYGSVLLPPAPAPDTMAPRVRIVLTPAVPDGANGWYRGPVDVLPQAQDDVGVIELRCALDPQVAPITYEELPEEICPFLAGAPVSEDGMHTLYAAAMDAAGNTSAISSVSFQIDATPPVITCPDPGPILLGSGDQAIGPAGVDASVSGLDEAAANVLSGIVSTGEIGPQVLTFTAFDLAGNSASQECSYAVIYDFGGPYPPVKRRRSARFFAIALTRRAWRSRVNG
jgi:hypothetical protein